MVSFQLMINKDCSHAINRNHGNILGTIQNFNMTINVRHTAWKYFKTVLHHMNFYENMMSISKNFQKNLSSGAL